MNTDRIIRIDVGDRAYVEYADGSALEIGDSSAGQSNDRFHTFDELYRHRALLTAALFNTWAARACKRCTRTNPGFTATVKCRSEAVGSS